MRKKYILDTSVLIDDPMCFRKFPKSDIIIPIVVLDELDKLKKQYNQAGKQARVAIKLLDNLTSSGDVNSGILIKETNGVLIIDSNYYDLSKPEFNGFGDPNYGDSQILASAYSYNKKYKKQIIFVSNDINLRLKAKARQIQTIEHKESSQFDDLYSGVKISNNEEAGFELQASGSIDANRYKLKLNPNECILFQTEDGKGISIGRKVSENKISVVRNSNAWGISSKNKEQAFAIDMLMDPNVDLVTLLGKAGSGKSLIALACGLELVLNKKQYDRLIIYRPVQPVGKDVGFLPGTLEEKLGPWFEAIMDGFEFLFSKNKNQSGNFFKDQDWKKDLEMFKNKGRIEMEALTYIRGRSIPNSIILLDECQNISKEEIKTVLTRAGENTKIILTGDVEQIDNEDLDVYNNGLTYVIEKFKSSSLAGHVTFVNGERSRLATLAANIL